MGTPNPGQYPPYQQQPYPQQPPSYPPGQPPPPPPPAYQGGYGAPAGYAPPPADPPGTYMGHPLAHWGSRFGAYLVDGLIVGVPTVILVFIMTFVATAVLGTTDPVTGATVPGAAGSLLVVVVYLAGIGVNLYNLVWLQGNTGQSWGKRVLNIRLVRMADGQPMGPAMTFVRALAHIADAVPLYIGFLWPLWDAHRQTFADKICSSLVLENRR